VPQGDFDGVIEAYRHALDAFLKLMVEVATGEADGEQRRLTIASTGMPNRGRPWYRRRTVVSALHLRLQMG
jgi:hypothetical protein